jgi:hypothetical protein
MFFMIKGYKSLRTIKSIWLHYLHTCCVLGLSFHLGKSLCKNYTFLGVENIANHVQPTLNRCFLTTCTFDLWMSKVAHDICSPLCWISCLITRSRKMFALGYLKQIIHLGQNIVKGAINVILH